MSSVVHVVEGTLITIAHVATTSKTTVYTVPPNSSIKLANIQIETGTPTTSITLGLELGTPGSFTEYTRLDAYDVGANSTETIDLGGITLNAGADINITGSANNANTVFLVFTLIARTMV